MSRKFSVMLFTALMINAGNAWASESPADGSLKQIMQQLGHDYSDLNHAILMSDFDGAAKSAHAIAYHDKPAKAQLKRVVSGLGTEMPAFKKADKLVHDLAISIEEAALSKNMSLLIERQSKMLSACVACHTSYRSKVIDLLK